MGQLPVFVAAFSLVRPPKWIATVDRHENLIGGRAVKAAPLWPRQRLLVFDQYMPLSSKCLRRIATGQPKTQPFPKMRGTAIGVYNRE